MAWMKAFRLLAICLALASPAFATEPVRPLKDRLQAMGIPADYRVSYADEQGRPMSAEAFEKHLPTHSFGIEKDPMKHTAILRFESDADVAREKAEIDHPRPLPLLGKAFPPIDASTLTGTRVANATYRGKTVLVNFFFALCGPCIQETPVLSAFHQAHPDIEVLAVTYDDKATASDFATRRKLNWPVLADQQALVDKAHVEVYPTMILIGPDGIVRKAASSSSIAGYGKSLTVQMLEQWVAGN